MPLSDAPRTEFRRLLGEENLHEGAHCEGYSVLGRAPSAALFPATLEEAAECAAICFRHGLAVAPWGGGTRMEFGRPLDRLDVALSTERLDSVLDYQPADMTVTVEAGITVTQLQELLKGEGQHLPLDPPRPDRATIGGVVATRDTGALRHSHGGPRDFLLGLKVADPEGQIVKGGSKVVKNVAGYDLPKLYTGSWGTLGLLAELTFRVVPIPEVRRSCLVSVPDPKSAEALLAKAMDSDLIPSFIELMNEPTRAVLLPDSKPGWTLAVGLDGAREDVEWEAGRLRDLCASVSGAAMESLDDEAGSMLRRDLADFPLAVESRFTARIAARSSAVAEVIRSIETLAADHGHSARIIAHAGVGLIELHAESRGESAGDSLACLEALRRGVPRGVRITVERAAPDLVGRFDPWPSIRDGLDLMETLKRSFDPKNLWNPGRFVVP